MGLVEVGVSLGLFISSTGAVSASTDGTLDGLPLIGLASRPTFLAVLCVQGLKKREYSMYIAI